MKIYTNFTPLLHQFAENYGDLWRVTQGTQHLKTLINQRFSLYTKGTEKKAGLASVILPFFHQFEITLVKFAILLSFPAYISLRFARSANP